MSGCRQMLLASGVGDREQYEEEGRGTKDREGKKGGRYRARERWRLRSISLI